MNQVDLALALLGNSDEKKIMKQVMDDWNVVDINVFQKFCLRMM